MTQAPGPRPLTEFEAQLLKKLLSVSFPGREELQQQALTAKVTTVLANGSPAWLFSIDESTPLAIVRHRIPVEAKSSAVAGKTVHCLLHVVDGKLSEVEFFREDGSPIRKLPRVLDFEVVAA